MTVELLEPVGPLDNPTHYVPHLVRASVLSGSEGSVPYNEKELEPTGIVRLRTRLLGGVTKDWFARIYGEYYRVTGIRKVPPGLQSEVQLEKDEAVDVAEFVTIGGKRTTIKGNQIVI